MRARYPVALPAALAVFVVGCLPSTTVRLPSSPKPLGSAATPVSPSVATASTAEPTDADEGVEPSPTVIRGGHVIAQVQAEPDSVTLAFEIWPFENRTLVAFCAAPFPQGCVQPQLRELASDAWALADSSLRGFPPLEALDLHAIPNSPFRDVSGEVDPCAEAHKGNVMWRESPLNGSRSIAATYGTFPDNAWAVVRLALDHSGGPVDDLYHWQGMRWQRIVAGTRLDDAIVAAQPFSEGLAIVRSQRGPKADQTMYELSYVSARNQRVLLGPQADVIRIAQLGDNLVAVSTADGLDPYSPLTEVRVALWPRPDHPPLTRVVQTNVPMDAMLLDVRIEKKFRITWQVSETQARELSIELQEPFADSIQSIPWAPPKETGPTLIESGPGNSEPLVVVNAWKVQGRAFWLATSGSPQNLTLLSDQPVKEVWNPNPIQVRLPKRPPCGAADHPKAARAPAKF